MADLHGNCSPLDLQSSRVQQAEERSSFMAPPPEEQPHIGTMGRIGQEQEVSWRNFICLSSHPVAAFFHLVSAPFRPGPSGLPTR